MFCSGMAAGGNAKDRPQNQAAPVHSAQAGGYQPEAGSTEEKRRQGKWAITPDPNLPNVLLIGDSISMGYTLHVRRLLAKKANVFRPSENCQGTTHGLKRIDEWLKGHRWDVIHFNWGLHDLKHVDPKTGKNSNSFSDPQQASPEQYRKNLTILVEKLKATGARLIFATTTPFPEGVKPARKPEDAKRYNAIALEIAKANGIRINDLYSLVLPRLKELQKPRNVHFKVNGYKLMAKQVAQVISEELAKKGKH
ncbi:MAG: SGNH/GDSL hydrolase family protein [Lentisphaerae bacterium]|nr:MAG: SGNH/GDSL hydrolase family protein [Lentisphaerota bacterium]